MHKPLLAALLVPAAALCLSSCAAAPEGPQPAAGNPQRTADTIQRALTWLAAHQDESGRWDADEFMKHDSEGSPTDGGGSPVHDIGVTGLALLAFLGDGNTLRTGPHREVVKRAVTWLREQQDEQTGLFGKPASNEFIYDHAIATFAMVEVYGLSNYKMLGPIAQRGINYLEQHRNPYAVWRYQPRDGDNDTSVTGWCLLAYTSARSFELEVNPTALEACRNWFDQMTDPATFRTGYTDRGGQSSRLAGDHANRYPRERGECMTAVSLMGRILIAGDTTPADSKEANLLRGQADRLAAKPPVWNAQDGSIDHDYWYYGTYAMYQMGGESWQAWRRALDSAVTPHQRDDANFDGSWDPLGVWGESGGRVYSTALCCLMMQANHRYARLVK